MKVLATYSKPEEASIVASYLEANGIFATVRDENMVTMYWLYSNAIGGVKLEVAEEDYERALEILNLPKESGGLLQCPHCGSADTRIRDLSMAAAMVIGVFGFLLPVPSVTVDCRQCKKSFKWKKNP